MNQPSEFSPPYAKPQAYQWVGKDGGFKVGTIAKDIGGVEIVKFRMMLESLDFRQKLYLMKHSHTGELEWVSWERLTKYPSAPIPEPEK